MANRNTFARNRPPPSSSYGIGMRPDLMLGPYLAGWFVMTHHLRASSLVAIFALLLQACAERKPLPVPSATTTTDCTRLFHEMDLRVDEYGVADAGTARISGFPELRVDRFLATYAKENLTGKAYAAWLERLRKLDETARTIEWRNLPPVARSELQAAFGPDIEKAVNVCRRSLAEQDLNSPDRRTRLLSAIDRPDAYSSWQRFFGFYFFTHRAFIGGVWRLHQELREPFLTTNREQPDTGRLLRYAPPTQDALDTAEIGRILAQSADNPLRIPEPSEHELSRLFSTFAPIWVVDTANDDDRIGAVQMGTDRNADIDTTKPSVYRLPSYTRFGNEVLLQLNYVVWFPARPSEHWLDIYAGRFDGLIWRVTLKMDGTPLAYDSIHPCGCYYQIFPGEGFRIVQPQDGSEPILSPMPILAKPGERLLLELASGTHFIRRITSERPVPESTLYGWLDYDLLRSLPTPGGQYHNFFDKDGLVPGSERPERFLLWPLGVPSAGAMRQWGTHAIAFLGKRHFDDPGLLAKLIRPLWE